MRKVISETYDQIMGIDQQNEQEYIAGISENEGTVTVTITEFKYGGSPGQKGKDIALIIKFHRRTPL
jgi:hypothetical protein